MICNTFRKQVNEYGNTFYYPVLKDYIHSEQFKYFFTYSFMNIPFMFYEPVQVISKKAAKKYIVCLDQE
jgi:hypothetical protein